MENITNIVKEKMQKVYSFTGTQLLITGVWIIILLSVVTGASAGKWHIKIKNHMMRWNKQEMQQQYDRQGRSGQQKKGISPDGRQVMRGQSSNQEQPTSPNIGNS